MGRKRKSKPPLPRFGGLSLFSLDLTLIPTFLRVQNSIKPRPYRNNPRIATVNSNNLDCLGLMEPLKRKREGGSDLLDGGAGDRGLQSKKKYRGPEKEGSCNAVPGPGVVMIGSSHVSAVRGLKRKLGCTDSATRFGRKKKLEHEYVMGLQIGKGKFGSVRKCRSWATGEECACKTLLKAGEETVHREVEIMQHLSGHPSVVTLKAVFEESDCFHLVMELCSGGRLLDQMAKEGMHPEQRAAKLLKELISVIKYCHEMGVVHRDIKPENILLTASGKVKLADFGLAVRVTSGHKLSGIAGSPAYIAPEVLSGHYSKKVDVWGAGVVLHALLVGVLPFQGNSLGAIYEAIKSLELDFHSGLWGSISGLARDLISRMLTRDVSARMTADEVLRHPWILFYTECPSKAMMPTRPRVTNSGSAPGIESARIWMDKGSSSLGGSSLESEEPDDSGFVDALAAAISRVKISEPKRSRLCGPVSPNLQANLCPAF